MEIPAVIPEQDLPPDPRFVEFVRLYNTGHYYESHEVLEDLWLDGHGPDRLFYQGLIMYSTAFLHLERGNLSGFSKLLVSAAAKLAGYPDRHMGVDLCVVRGAIAAWRGRLARHAPESPVGYDPALIPPIILD